MLYTLAVSHWQHVVISFLKEKHKTLPTFLKLGNTSVSLSSSPQHVTYVIPAFLLIVLRFIPAYFQ